MCIATYLGTYGAIARCISHAKRASKNNARASEASS